MTLPLFLVSVSLPLCAYLHLFVFRGDKERQFRGKKSNTKMLSVCAECVSNRSSNRVAFESWFCLRVTALSSFFLTAKVTHQS